MFKPQVAISVSYIRYAPFVQVTCETEVIPKFKNETKNEEKMGSMMNSDSQSEPMNYMHHSSSMSPAMDHMMKM